MIKKKVVIIGGGPSALIAAYFLSPKCDVTIYEKEKNVGQKFLVAGKGGFNITNSLQGIDLAKKYSNYNSLRNAILKFDSHSVRNWLENLGIKTFIGTSGRVFCEKYYKPIEVLDIIKKSLIHKNVKIFTNQKFIRFNNNIPIFSDGKSEFHHEAEFYIFALGGATWPVTGSDGKWIKAFNDLGITTNSFSPSNCGININWPENILAHHIGKPLKNINIHVGNSVSSGEAVITNYGLEGNAIYAIVPFLRKSLMEKNASIYIDFKPNNEKDDLLSKLKNKKISSEKYKAIFNLNSSELALIKSFTTKQGFLSPSNFVNYLKKFRLKVDSLRPIEEAISSIGGIDTNELMWNFALKKFQNIFTIGEMVDWDAPTGGFLLQGCFSMGVMSAKSILAKLN